jgi:hypothetical protein
MAGQNSEHQCAERVGLTQRVRVTVCGNDALQAQVGEGHGAQEGAWRAMLELARNLVDAG